MSEQDDAKLRKLLRASPKLAPPESFYRGVLEKIERKSAKTEEKTPWYWGYSVKAFATACVLMVIVLVTRETKKTQPQGLDQIQSESRPAPALHNFPTSAPKSFEKLDDQEMDKVVAMRKVEPALKQKRAEIVMQARDTATGVASQDSFGQEQNSLQEKKGNGIRARDMPMAMNVSPRLAESSGGLSGGELSSDLGANAAASPMASVPMRKSTLAKNIQKGFEIVGPLAGREILQKNLPVYPAWALEQGLQGLVSIYIQVTPLGTVKPEIRVTRTTRYPKLDQVAVEAVKKWQFSPAPEESWGIISFQFTPRN